MKPCNGKEDSLSISCEPLVSDTPEELIFPIGEMGMVHWNVLMLILRKTQQKLDDTLISVFTFRHNLWPKWSI